MLHSVISFPGPTSFSLLASGSDLWLTLKESPILWFGIPTFCLGCPVGSAPVVILHSAPKPNPIVSPSLTTCCAQLFMTQGRQWHTVEVLGRNVPRLGRNVLGMNRYGGVPPSGQFRSTTFEAFLSQHIIWLSNPFQCSQFFRWAFQATAWGNTLRKMLIHCGGRAYVTIVWVQAKPMQ